MISAILNSAMLDSDTAILDSNTLLSFLRLTQKHSHSILTLTQTNSIWLTRWWQPYWILPSWIQPFPQKNFTQAFSLKLMMAAILKSAILDPAILHKKKLHLFILTQLDDCSHHEFCHLGFRHCHLGFRHLVIFSQIHSKTLFLHSEPHSN